VQLWDGTRSEVNLLVRDSARDLAVLRAPKSGLPFVTLADSDRVRVSELVIAIGNPLGFVGALTTGIVHAVGRVRGLGPTKWIQADVRLAPGNSGGPLANAQGRLVGINTMVSAGVGLAVPSNAVSRLLGGKFSQAPLGVLARPVEITVSGRSRLGLLILQLEADGAAQTASLMPGDIVIGIEGREVDSADDFERVLEGDDDRVVRLQFLRGIRTNTRTVAVRLGASNRAAA
jgi:serine protease Do